jgi:hypothetical protein
LLQENEYNDISESEYSSDSEINVNILSGVEQSVSFDQAENVSNNSSKQSGCMGKFRCWATMFSVYWQAWYKC